jgi:hypothetical protein
VGKKPPHFCSSAPHFLAKGPAGKNADKTCETKNVQKKIKSVLTGSGS